MPRRTRACVGCESRSRPANCTSPLPALRSPITVFMSVVLPAPLRPMRPIMARSGTENVTPRRICTASIATARLRTSSMRGLGAADDVPAHFRVGERDLRRRVGDDASIVEGEHALREPAHYLHVVLDEEHGGAFRAHR